MKKLICFAGLVSIFLPALAAAQTPDNPPSTPAQDDVTAIQINQPFVSKNLGEFTLPFLWEVQEQDQRLVVTETRNPRPAVINIDLFKLNKNLDEKNVSDEIIQSVAQNLGTSAQMVQSSEKAKCGKSKCPALHFYRASFAGMEDGVERKCALEILPASGKLLVFSICADAARKYDPDLPDLIHQVFEHMK